jgi:hypothetical protein
VRFRVFINGKESAGSQGVDVAEHGAGLVSEARIYQLIRQHDGDTPLLRVLRERKS